VVDYPTSAHYNTLLPFEVGVAPLPLRGGAGESLDAQSLASTEFLIHVYYVSPHTDVPQLCWEWLTFLSSQPQQLLPARRSVAASSEWQEQVEDATLPAYLATLEYANAPVLNMRMLTPWSWVGYTYPWLDEAFQATVAGVHRRVTHSTHLAQTVTHS
jgi:hypothetical protein